MSINYNRIAGQSIERLAALSDGLFAVAMTLLVLDLHAPAAAAIHSEHDLWHAVISLAPRLLVYVMSFLTLGIFWIGQQTQLNYIARGDRNLAWIHLTFLFIVSLMPFSTALIAEFIVYRVALVIYWANILMLGLLLLMSWRYSVKARLIASEAPPHISQSIHRRIFVSQVLYGFGALLCVINTYWSLGFIVLVQLNYAIAPRLGTLSRI